MSKLEGKGSPCLSVLRIQWCSDLGPLLLLEGEARVLEVAQPVLRVVRLQLQLAHRLLQLGHLVHQPERGRQFDEARIMQIPIGLGKAQPRPREEETDFFPQLGHD